MGGTLANLSRAKRALIEARTLDDVLEIRDKAEAIRVYVKAAGEGLDAQNFAAEIKLRAERKAGALLAEMEMQGPGEYQRSHDATVGPPSLSDIGINKTQSSRWQKEAGVTEQEFDAHVAKCNTERVELTQASVLSLAGAGHVSQASGENEWYTPLGIIDRARKAMGGIDLDPASCELAQRHVKAKRFYAIADDGLSLPWNGRVWLNPPYARELCAMFTAKLIESVSSGDVPQACALVNNATETTWCQLLITSSTAICFHAGRISFLDKNGQPSNSPLQGQLIAYIGTRSTEFAACFCDVGAIVFQHV